MAKKNVLGICGLCQKDRVLCRSHYVGHAIQRLCRQAGEAPILMTPKVILATARQLWAHLLYQGCEDRLNRMGENVGLRSAPAVGAGDRHTIRQCERRFDMGTSMCSASCCPRTCCSQDEPHLRSLSPLITNC